MPSNNSADQEEKSVSHLSQSAFSIGRKVGVLLLLQLIAALTLPFILSKPITLGSPAFLTAVTEQALQIRMAVLLSFIGAGLTVYLGITAFQVFRRYSTAGALLFLAVCVVSCLLDLVHGGSIISMLAIGDRFATASAQASELYQVVGASVASARRSAHIIQLFGIGAWMLVFYLSLFRFRLIPRALASVGLIGVLLQFTGVTLMMFLGHRPIGEMAMPLLPIQILVAGWLIAKGFNFSTLTPSTPLSVGQSG